MAAIKPRAARGFVPTAQAAFTKIRGVNKTDAVTLLNTFGSVGKVAAAKGAQLRACPGLAEKKVTRLLEAFHQPFSACGASSRLASNAKRRRLGLPSLQDWRKHGTAAPGGSAGGTSAATSSPSASPLAPGVPKVEAESAHVLDVEGMLQVQADGPPGQYGGGDGEEDAVIISSDEDSDD